MVIHLVGRLVDLQMAEVFLAKDIDRNMTHLRLQGYLPMGSADRYPNNTKAMS
jgi:hypothetical protein